MISKLLVVAGFVGVVWVFNLVGDHVLKRDAWKRRREHERRLREIWDGRADGKE